MTTARTFVRAEPVLTTCFCVGVDFGTYANVVSMKIPFPGFSRDGWIDVDACLASTIGWLWANGVVTMASCCGHGRLRPSVCVSSHGYSFMEQRFASELTECGQPSYLVDKVLS